MMKRRIKECIVKLPFIRGFMYKWIKARLDIEELQMKNMQQEEKISELLECMRQEELCCDLHQVGMLQFERNMAYYRMLDNKPGLTEYEMSLAQEMHDLRSSRPFVSIIILNRNGRQHLEVLMTSFHKHKFYDNFEIIFVDNGSIDDSITYIESWEQEFKIRIIRNIENMSFSAANNLGAQSAQGEYLLFLNNDIEVTDGWMDELLIAIRHAERPGAIGAKLFYPLIPHQEVNAGKSYCVQHAGIAFRDAVQDDEYFIQPYNIGNGRGDYVWEKGAAECAGVTAAVLLVSKNIFNEVGGFDENYLYGYEDVDFCLKLIKAGYRNYCCKSCIVYHYEFGTQKDEDIEKVRARRLHNVEVLKGRWHSYLSRKIFDEKLDNNKHVLTERKLLIAMVVTEADISTAAGDFFTAMELAGSLKKLGYEVKYLSRRGESDWYDVGVETDVLISFLDIYDLSRIYHTKNGLVKIAWARNWFDRWCERSYFSLFDIVLASSQSACRYIDEHSDHTAILFPIAAGERFFSAEKYSLPEEEKEKYSSDYAFTGSYWNVKRGIIDCLCPSELPYTFKLFGANWEQVDKLKDYACGQAPYEDMIKIYHNTKIIVDDVAAESTRRLGSVNSRVFDALAAGALVLTNGIKGADETFEGLLPSFCDKEEFVNQLCKYLENEQERKQVVKKLQKFVLENHTYDIRAKKLVEILKDFNKDWVDVDRIDICGAMPEDESINNWGDYHFAQAMKKEFGRQGYQVNILSKNRWYEKSNAKYIIVLRGTKAYFPAINDGRKFIMWNISHPEDVTAAECNLYDFVFFASKKMKDKMDTQIHTASGLLLQCTDPEIMSCDEQARKKYELLFVGNSRGIYRPILKDLLPTKYKLSVYGMGWEHLPVKEHVIGRYLDNEQLGQAYHDAKIVLNDHWNDMKEYGIISNRIFDALAVGAFIISDHMPEIDQLFHGSVVSYRDAQDLESKVRYYLKNEKERVRLAKQGQEIVLAGHTFAIRVHEICSVLKQMEC